MRRIILAAILSLALAPAAFAESTAAKCIDAAGKPTACPQPPKGEVNITAPVRTPDEGLSPTLKSPDSTIPPMATALCKDGTYSKSPQPTTACSIHGGVAQWVR